MTNHGGVKSSLRLFKVEAHPNRIAISGADTFATGGAFFLDFSRPLELKRWLGVGPAFGAAVPVVHEGQSAGRYFVRMQSSNPYFCDVQELWRQRYPAAVPAPVKEADALKIIADFASQFPGDARSTPHSAREEP